MLALVSLAKVLGAIHAGDKSRVEPTKLIANKLMNLIGSHTNITHLRCVPSHTFGLSVLSGASGITYLVVYLLYPYTLPMLRVLVAQRHKQR